MKSLTIIYCTARTHPEFDWFFESLLNDPHEPLDVIIVDSLAKGRDAWDRLRIINGNRVVQHVAPKPNVWQGEHRLTKDEWWAKSNALNTGICLAKTEWVMFVDDRSFLMPGWVAAVKDAMQGDYAVCGTYEKRIGMEVSNGKITKVGQVVGKDPRRTNNKSEPHKTYGMNWFGCVNALPLEWCLEINGFDESCDSMRYEDTIFGHMLSRNGHVTKFDRRMMLIEDRTMPQSETGLRGIDKGESPNDKSHALLRRTDGKKQATHNLNLRAVRDAVQRGEPFPITNEPRFDWYDAMKVEDFDRL